MGLVNPSKSQIQRHIQEVQVWEACSSFLHVADFWLCTKFQKGTSFWWYQTIIFVPIFPLFSCLVMATASLPLLMPSYMFSRCFQPFNMWSNTVHAHFRSPIRSYLNTLSMSCQQIWILDVLQILSLSQNVGPPILHGLGIPRSILISV